MQRCKTGRDHDRGTLFNSYNRSKKSSSVYPPCRKSKIFVPPAPSMRTELGVQIILITKA